MSPPTQEDSYTRTLPVRSETQYPETTATPSCWWTTTPDTRWYTSSTARARPSIRSVPSSTSSTQWRTKPTPKPFGLWARFTRTTPASSSHASSRRCSMKRNSTTLSALLTCTNSTALPSELSDLSSRTLAPTWWPATARPPSGLTLWSTPSTASTVPPDLRDHPR